MFVAFEKEVKLYIESILPSKS